MTKHLINLRKLYLRNILT